MKVYKNPYVSRESYFVKTGKARTGKAEASASSGYCIEFLSGKWDVRKCTYYDDSLKNEFLIVGENNRSIESVINRAVLDAVLDLVGEQKAKEGE